MRDPLGGPQMLRIVVRIALTCIIALPCLATSCFRVARINLRPVPATSSEDSTQASVLMVVDSIARHHDLRRFISGYQCSYRSSDSSRTVGEWGDQGIGVALCVGRSDHIEVVVRRQGFGSAKETLIYGDLISGLRARLGSDIVVGDPR